MGSSPFARTTQRPTHCKYNRLAFFLSFRDNVHYQSRISAVLPRNMTPVSLLLKPLAYLAEDFILHILIERGNPGTVAAAFLHVDPEILLLGVIQPFTYA